MPGQSFPKAARLVRRHDFKRVKDHGVSAAGRLFVLQALMPSGGSRARIGIVTSKKAGGAVARSRMRRLIRECFRLHQTEYKNPVDFVVVARWPLASSTFAETQREWLRLCSLLEVIDSSTVTASARKAKPGKDRRFNAQHGSDEITSSPDPPICLDLPQETG